MSDTGRGRGGQTASRREVLRGVAGATSAAVGVGASTGSVAAGKDGDCREPDYSTPHLATADHFDTNWYGSVYRTDGNTATNYDVEGTGFPWGANDLVLHVHGWQNDYQCGVVNVENTQRAYDGVAYDPAVSGLAWGSNYAWWNAKEIAEETAPKLANFLYTYNNHYPNATIRVHGHSLGAKVLAETILQLYHWGGTDVLDTAVFLAGAVVDEEVSMGGTYGTAIEQVVGHAENYWDADDSVLNWAFSTYEWSWAIGNNGCNGTPPSNYTDHEVTGFVDAHYAENYVNSEFLGNWVVPEF